MSDRLYDVLVRIAAALEDISVAQATKAPYHRFPLGWFPQFDWTKIGAEVVHRDRDGAAVVMWKGYTFVRRAVNKPKFGKALIFSRNSSEDESGYDTLVKFVENMEIGLIPDDIAREAGVQGQSSAAPAVSLLVASPKTQSTNGGSAAATQQPANSRASAKQSELRARALGAVDAGQFDTHVAKLFPQFGNDPKKVAQARSALFPDMPDGFDVSRVEPIFAAIEAYTKARAHLDKLGFQLLDSHNQAKAKAMETYAQSVAKQVAN